MRRLCAQGLSKGALEPAPQQHIRALVKTVRNLQRHLVGLGNSLGPHSGQLPQARGERRREHELVLPVHLAPVVQHQARPCGTSQYPIGEGGQLLRDGMPHAPVAHVDALRDVRLRQEERVYVGEGLVQVVDEAYVAVLHDMHVLPMPVSLQHKQVEHRPNFGLRLVHPAQNGCQVGALHAVSDVIER
eukprot:CAMPEP_0114273460 /NCGR_PEP_ID=MMETSP0058-20121206/29121_1 /TAXON_ID=36894 /ORGANISM="Pyramimonas parkeae, CCMP726" /LENGTH=187 /DNA_ID=CAMNT_0001392941 /DNA_START=243 /DNA_END=806 /DNA_ORIENTATION=-